MQGETLCARVQYPTQQQHHEARSQVAHILHARMQIADHSTRPLCRAVCYNSCSVSEMRAGNLPQAKHLAVSRSPTQHAAEHSHFTFHSCTSPFIALMSIVLHKCWCNACRVTVTLGGCLLAAMALTRSVLPRSLRFLATHSSAELVQLTVLAFCLVSAWISGYLVSLTSSLPRIFS